MTFRLANKAIIILDGIHFWGDEWNGKSVLEARSLFENGMIQTEIQRKREGDFQYSNREIANNEPPTLLREKRSGAGGFFIYVVLCQERDSSCNLSPFLFMMLSFLQISK